ncbi:Large cysteine-rich periplasmic protein omcB precursor [Novipirellula aureliae]|uniref:Large cysteine-rich periplasmic protein omcB n=1 Tax=Novipirellula aureliae TaxID=2527966 RepID=A0A5C6DY43_9BACT|nr:DUF11 domain-containing protein [Novipirellula aureliae]TWU41542.1 Large cysteine-rich periplasmic protein omcB precursor [Novipirellula aureliae]
MKPFGIRLAAGAVTILLGALAAAQAQKDRGDDKESDWSLNTPAQVNVPPTPIEALSNDSPPAFAASSQASNQPSAVMHAAMQHSDVWGSSGAVEQVQYTEPNAMPIPAGLEYQPATEPENDPAYGAELDLPAIGATSANTDSQSSDWGMPSEMAQTDLPTPANQMPSFEMSTPGGDQELAIPDRSMSVQDEPSLVPEADDERTNTSAAEPSNMLRSTVPVEPETSSQELDLNQFAAPNFDNSQLQEPQYAAPPYDESQSTPPLAAESQYDPPQSTQSLAAEPQYDPPQSTQSLAAEPQYDPPQPAQSLAAESQYDPPQAAQSLAAESQYDPSQAAPMAYDQPASDASQPSQAPNYEAPNYGAAAYGAAAYESPAYEAAPQSYPAGQPIQRIASRTTDSRSLQQAPMPMQTPIAAQPVQVNPDSTFASPGDRRLEGLQSPSVVIQKRAPSEVKVGKPASFVIHVQNVGSVEALDVQIHDRVPAGMRLVDASPAPSEQGGVLVWNLGSMPAGDERTVTMQLIPEQEGELGSVARVSFEAAASVRTVSTRPELKVVQRAPEQVLIGQQLEIEVEVSNPGTGSATGVIVQEDVPEGLDHPKGKQLDNFLGDLAAGEVRHQVLRLRAVAPGVIENQIRLTADDGLTAMHSVAVEVIAPEVQVGLVGPSRRFLERQATYQLEIANTGTADATNVEVVAQLDRGFTFVSTDFEGQYDPARHAVYWSLASLPKGKNGKVPLTLLPVEEGNRKIMIEAKADLGTVAQSESFVTVESLAELSFQISDSSDPIEVGGETTYEIRLANSGSRDDSNVRVQLQLPPGIERMSADGDAQEDGRGGIFFAPKTQMPANSELVYRVRVRGTTPGTHIVKAIVTSDQSAVPVTKEESTMVYSDR